MKKILLISLSVLLLVAITVLGYLGFTKISEADKQQQAFNSASEAFSLPKLNPTELTLMDKLFGATILVNGKSYEGQWFQSGDPALMLIMNTLSSKSKAESYFDETLLVEADGDILNEISDSFDRHVSWSTTKVAEDGKSSTTYFEMTLSDQTVLLVFSSTNEVDKVKEIINYFANK